MKKIIALLIISFILTSCNLIPSKKNPITEANIRTGTQGLVMSFLKGTPPSTVYESAEKAQEGIFDFSVLLENKGAANIAQGHLAVAYEEDYITSSPTGGWAEGGYQLYSPQENTMQFDLKGKSLESPVGEIKTVSNSLKTKMLESLSEKHDSLILLTACYDYSTILSAAVCIDPNPYETGTKPCTVKDLTFSSQGAPVAITKIETAMLTVGNSVKPEFKIYVRNSGGGKVVNKEKIDLACKSKLSDDEKKDLWNIVDIKLSLGRAEESESAFECTPLPIRLKGEEDFIRCVYNTPISAETSYTTPLVVNISYGYTQTVSKSITILKNPSLHAPLD